MYIYVSNVSQLIKPRAVQLVIGDEVLQCPHNNVVLYSTSASYYFQRSYYLSIVSTTYFCKFTLYLYDLSSKDQPSYTFVHSLYVFCHYHYYKPTCLYTSELINVFIYFVTYRPIGPGAFVCLYM